MSSGRGGGLTLQVSGGMPKITVNNQTTTINAPISGTQGFDKAGAGTLVLGAANNYTGGTVIDAGTVVIKSDSNLGGGALTINGGTLEVSANITSTRNIVLGNAAAVISVDAGTTYSAGAGATVSGTGGLTKGGIGDVGFDGCDVELHGSDHRR